MVPHWGTYSYYYHMVYHTLAHVCILYKMGPDDPLRDLLIYQNYLAQYVTVVKLIIMVATVCRN